MNNETVFSPMFREKANNYLIQAENARKLFLGYDTKELARKFSLKMDETYLYAPMMGREYRIERSTGRMEKKIGKAWGRRKQFCGNADPVRCALRQQAGGKIIRLLEGHAGLRPPIPSGAAGTGR